MFLKSLGEENRSRLRCLLCGTVKSAGFQQRSLCPMQVKDLCTCKMYRKMYSTILYCEKFSFPPLFSPYVIQKDGEVEEQDL